MDHTLCIQFKHENTSFLKWSGAPVSALQSLSFIAKKDTLENARGLLALTPSDVTRNGDKTEFDEKNLRHTVPWTYQQGRAPAYKAREVLQNWCKAEFPDFVRAMRDAEMPANFPDLNPTACDRFRKPKPAQNLAALSIL
ncbi:hypothetical protein ANCCEY_12290 [Ancylostoma ceylanicum]|uniref:Uncharacterized protein n=1 Tax=Ancylostoma ceylanicum TaxID=53326 RepID=A0A0D6L9K1_9BILA|nr:hypothetical protein ANCCEY_12290 [Ancylostoma ceylanicum]